MQQEVNPPSIWLHSTKSLFWQRVHGVFEHLLWGDSFLNPILFLEICSFDVLKCSPVTFQHVKKPEQALFKFAVFLDSANEFTMVH